MPGTVTIGPTGAGSAGVCAATHQAEAASAVNTPAKRPSRILLCMSFWMESAISNGHLRSLDAGATVSVYARLASAAVAARTPWVPSASPEPASVDGAHQARFAGEHERVWLCRVGA